MTDHQIPDDFDEFKSTMDTLFHSVTDINRFQYRAQVSFAGRWRELIDTDRLALRLQSTILDALRLAEFHSAGDLEVAILQTGIRLSYSDPEYGFDFEVHDDGSITLTRAGSSLSRFHQWYSRLMPSAAGILNDAVAGLAAEILAKTLVQRELTINSVYYTFRLVAYDFQESNGPRGTTTNLDLIKRTMSRLPDTTGRLVASQPMKRDEFGRIDYQVSRWLKNDVGTINDVYRVEAPSNNQYSSLWFTFSTGGTTYIGPSGEREPMDANTIVSPVMTTAAYVEFFRDRALRGFVSDLAKGYTFKTTPSSLP